MCIFVISLFYHVLQHTGLSLDPAIMTIMSHIDTTTNALRLGLFSLRIPPWEDQDCAPDGFQS
jgi:hypothetical protein